MREQIDELVRRAEGRWAGTERILLDPATRKTAEASAELETSAILGGLGLSSTYEQSTAGRPSLRCHTVHRLAADGSLRLHWFPETGEPQIFVGQVRELLLEAQRSDDEGLTHILRADYGTPGEMTTRMSVAPPGTGEVVVFEGRYTRQPEPLGRPQWRDLTVAHAPRVRDFYQEVLGWTAEGCDMGGYEDYSMADCNGEVVAGVCHARGVNAELPPVWLVYFSVPDVEAAIQQAVKHGGRLVAGPMGGESQRYAVLADPAGAQFAVHCSSG